MNVGAEALEKWAERLGLEDEALRERARRVLATEPTSAELRAIAAERDKIAMNRDTIAGQYDVLADARDVAAGTRDRVAADRAEQARDEGDPEPSDGDAAQDRVRAADDREASHGDRVRSLHDREHAADNRHMAAEDRDRAAEHDHVLTGLRVALESRLVIGQAQGLLMARHAVSADTAFAVLVRFSQQSNTKLREVAAQLIAAEEHPPAP